MGQRKKTTKKILKHYFSLEWKKGSFNNIADLTGYNVQEKIKP